MVPRGAGIGNDAYAVGFGALGEVAAIHHLQIPQPRDQNHEYHDRQVVDDLQSQTGLPQVFGRIEGLIICQKP